ncbi:hypothetical protein ACRYCC_26290 [Actinomadura scrupuli]|uniref:hypothetical protein n=1 Tax=Actinomadura scrupuli TaxID=559629 RepID=UPI003D980A30
MSEPTDDGLVEVRTTMRPWAPLRVTETERQHLLNEGLLEEQVQIAEQVAATTTPPPAKPTTNKQKEG